MEYEVVVEAKAKLGEGPCWDEAKQKLIWVDIENNKVFEFDPGSGVNHEIALKQKVGAAVLTQNDQYLCGLVDGLAWIDASGEINDLLPIERSMTNQRMNDGKCDCRGRFFIGTMDMREYPEKGAFYRLDCDGSISKLFDKVSISNGLDWNSDYTRMYYIDTPTLGVDFFDYDVETGKPSNRQRLISIGADQGYPDGMTVDAEGYLWIAFWDGGCVRRYSPDGELDRTINLPASRITSLAFGGPNLDQLYITSAMKEGEQLGGSLFRASPGVKGRKSYRFNDQRA